MQLREQEWHFYYLQKILDFDILKFEEVLDFFNSIQNTLLIDYQQQLNKIIDWVANIMLKSKDLE